MPVVDMILQCKERLVSLSSLLLFVCSLLVFGGLITKTSLTFSVARLCLSSKT